MVCVSFLLAFSSPRWAISKPAMTEGWTPRNSQSLSPCGPLLGICQHTLGRSSRPTGPRTNLCTMCKVLTASLDRSQSSQMIIKSKICILSSALSSFIPLFTWKVIWATIILLHHMGEGTKVPRGYRVIEHRNGRWGVWI
jgi:hypothetical protein